MEELKHLLTKLKHLFSTESKLPVEKRAKHQFQLFVSFEKTQLIVGKGGANTGFIVFRNQRKVMYPADLLHTIESLSKSEYLAYSITKNGKDMLVDYEFDRQELLKSKPILGAYIVGIDKKGKAHKLYRAQSGLVSNEWSKCK